MPEHIKLNEDVDFAAMPETTSRQSRTPAAKRWVWQQYDHMVQTNTVEAPARAMLA